MDLELLQYRASILQNIRRFFTERGYLETDTPALAPALIPETCLEVFKTEYAEPWSGNVRPLYLVPSPEIYLKKIIAQHRVNIFQLSKCYRNVESIGRIHSPEFTMLEYYTIDSDYTGSAALTEELFAFLLPAPEKNGNAAEDLFADLRPPFARMTMDDAFARYAGFRLSSCPSSADLAREARAMGLSASDSDAWDDLYELIFVQAVEPSLPRDKPVLLTDYPARVPCLAKDIPPSPENGYFPAKERWELYARGVELANCYTEENDPEKVRQYFEREGALKKKTAKIQHETDEDFPGIFAGFPPCSGVALGADRLVMLMACRKSLATVLPFPF